MHQCSLELPICQTYLGTITQPFELGVGQDDLQMSFTTCDVVIWSIQIPLAQLCVMEIGCQYAYLIGGTGGKRKADEKIAVQLTQSLFTFF